MDEAAALEHPDDFVTDSSMEEEEEPDRKPPLEYYRQAAERLALTQASPAVQRRIKALKKLNASLVKLETECFNEVVALDGKHRENCRSLFEQRHAIVTGAYQPTDEEARWPLDSASPEDATGEKSINAPGPSSSEQVGIPGFWLKVFQNANLLSKVMQPRDVPILSHLEDVKITYKVFPMWFTLFFHFAPNKYFTNTVLTKEYFRTDHDQDNLNFTDPQHAMCKGCAIEWNEGMNTTQTVIRKVEKNEYGVTKIVNKTVKCRSFFNFFSPPEMPPSGQEIDDELMYLLSVDFEIGHYIGELVIPRAVLFYTGEWDEVNNYENDYFYDSTEESDADNQEIEAEGTKM